MLCRWACFPRGLEQWSDARIAVLDWALPEMSGFELLGALRERRIGLPGVFLTGYSLVELELQAMDHGAIDFVDKARGYRGAGPPLARDPRGAAPDACPGDARGRASRRVGFVPFNSARPMATAGHRFDRHRIQDREATGIRQGNQSYCAIYDTAHHPGFVAGSSALGYTINVRSLIKRIRRKFLAVDPGFSAIKNVHRIGYRWLDPEN